MSKKNNPANQGQTRREFLTTAGAAGAAGLSSFYHNPSQAALSFTSQCRTRKSFPGGRPNILIIMVDEMRLPPPYEDSLADWRKQNFKAQEWLRDSGMEFTHHYTGATACAAARTTFHTGLYPSVHGVTQVNGAAKAAADADMFWLDPGMVPTIGNYFRTAGYQTHYRGKWHVSDADIIKPGTQEALPSYHPNGARDYERENLYSNADKLNAFGYSGWIGPEPHGKNSHDSGGSAANDGTPGFLSGRDSVYADQTIELLDYLNENNRYYPPLFFGESATPWLIVSSFVNPHDIALYGFISRQLDQTFDFSIDPDVPFIPSAPADNIDTKPSAQKSYRQTYEEALQPTFNTPEYRRLYYQLQSKVDQEIYRVLAKLKSTRFYNDTIVIFTSDHGELLGSHDGLHQKWHVAYEEVTRVPMIVHSPRFFQGRQTVDMLTSHVDVLPTLLGLACIDPVEVQDKLRETHAEVQPLVGRDLSPLFHGQTPAGAGEPIFFMTDDEPTRGLNQQNFIGFEYNSVMQPNHIISTVATIQTSKGPKLFKYNIYYDNPQFWSDPGNEDEVLQEIGLPGHQCDVQEIKTTPVPEEYEMYDLSDDPEELHNLVQPSANAIWDTAASQVGFSVAELETIRDELMVILQEQCESKRRTPQTGVPQGFEDCDTIIS